MPSTEWFSDNAAYKIVQWQRCLQNGLVTMLSADIWLALVEAFDNFSPLTIPRDSSVVAYRGKGMVWAVSIGSRAI